MTSMLLALSLAPAAWAGAADSLDADEGSLTPVKGRAGVYTLVLRDISERPATVRALLDEFLGEDDPDPTATVEAKGEDAMRLRIASGVYDAKRDALRLRVLVSGSGLPRELDDVSLKISALGAGGRSSPVYVFNTTFQTLSVTVNGGPAFQLPGASFPYGLPVQPRDSVDFVASSPAKGQMSYGRNKLTADMYYGQPVAFNVDIPQTGPISTIQLYLFTDGAGVRWTALDNGRPIASGSSG